MTKEPRPPRRTAIDRAEDCTNRRERERERKKERDIAGPRVHFGGLKFESGSHPRTSRKSILRGVRAATPDI